MAVDTKIEWCDHSASPWHGCARVHAGCENCYAERQAKRNPAVLGTWGPDGTRVKSKSFIGNLRKWNEAAGKEDRIVSVFPSICDPFEDRPELEPWRREMFEVIDQCPSIRLLLLTKRPENVRRMWPISAWRDRPGIDNPMRRNVWLLTSVSDQPTADAMIPPLLECRDLVPVLGLSCEPLLGAVDLRLGQRDEGRAWERHLEIDWIIVGGESGPGARPMNLAWARSLVQQCKAAGVPCFVKQDSGPKPGAQGRIPNDLWVKEFPGVA